MSYALIEDSKQCFERLTRENNNLKFLKALGQIKSGCDKIEAIRGDMNYTSIATLANVSASTIKNAKTTHKVYVLLRIKEYQAKKPSTPSKTVPEKQITALPKYPANDLDQKTTEFIDDLWRQIEDLKQRNTLLEKASVEIQKHILDVTRSCPLDATEMITSTWDDEGSMSLKPPQSNTAIMTMTSELNSALTKIVKFDEIGKPLCIRNGALVLETPSRTINLLLPNELRAIKDVV